MDGRIKKLREKLKQTKHQLDDCVKRVNDKEVELEVAHNKIESMNRELTTLENLKIEYNQNNIEQARSLQDFISQLTELQEEFQTLAQAQHETKLLCKQKDERIKKEKQRRRETELICEKLKSREKHLKVKHDVTERQLNEANFESHQVAVNLKEAHDWFKNKFTNLQSELKKSRRIQNVLQKDNIDHYKALHEERRRADEATERAKDIIKSSREMISKLVGQVTSTTTINHETNEISHS
ncbi:coiled-coil domain-containing protein 150-like [Xenia sp. Carnegie-2017]|uniref:coiled-coil domain-containing protein 150-like n=1 Tax=Xenia sp. Carnegie-2017 TaxID=2897299 RepID=UPI001F036DAB|nr:coiled-coil domain-containing protein 150-like [Xenia sp. Carnegie-2017]